MEKGHIRHKWLLLFYLYPKWLEGIFNIELSRCPPCCARSLVSARRSPPRTLGHQSRCVEVRQRGELGCFRRGSAVNRCGCGNAVAGGCRHCWTLGGDVRTDTGAVSGWLSSKLSGCFGDVDGSPGQLCVARNRAAGCFFPSLCRGFSALYRGEGIRERQRRIPQHYGATHCRQREY